MRAIDVNKRKVVRLVGCDPLGVSKTRNRDGLAIVRGVSRRDQIAVAAHHNCGSVLDHSPDAAETLEMGLDETETQTPPTTRHERQVNRRARSAGSPSLSDRGSRRPAS